MCYVGRRTDGALLLGLGAGHGAGQRMGNRRRLGVWDELEGRTAEEGGRMGALG